MMRKLTRGIKPLSALLTKMSKPPHKLVRCIGGPFAGKTLDLCSENGDCVTLPFLFKNEIGRYQGKDAVTWTVLDAAQAQEPAQARELAQATPRPRRAPRRAQEPAQAPAQAQEPAPAAQEPPRPAQAPPELAQARELARAAGERARAELERERLERLAQAQARELAQDIAAQPEPRQDLPKEKPVMLNRYAAYFEAGCAAGRARRQGDESRAQFERDFFNRMRALETDESRAAADVAYHDGYVTGRGRISPGGAP